MTQTFVDNSPAAFAVIIAAQGVIAAGFAPLGMFLNGVFGLGWGSTILAVLLAAMNISGALLLRGDAFVLAQQF